MKRQKAVCVPVPIEVQDLCLRLRGPSGAAPTPEELIADLLSCIGQTVTRPGSWEAAIGRDFLESHGFEVAE